jgi:LuxR family maltose regulon positive regulatory protein
MMPLNAYLAAGESMLQQVVRKIPSHAVDRPALRAQLDDGLAAPVSLIVASAGAGKSVLLSQWANSHPELAIAWLDVTSAAGDPLVFSQELDAALRAVTPEWRAPSAPVVTAERRLGERYLEELAAGFRGGPRVVIVLDDLDRLTGTPLLTDLWRLVDMLPAEAHLVFASRTDLHLAWSRQRLQYGMVEIRQRELAFDDATTAVVLERLLGHPVEPETAAAVTARTEGWAVGVQLTALTMRVAAEPERVVETMSGTDRLIMDYLSQEVLEALPSERRVALMELAVLDEVCSSLAEAVTGQDGMRLIDELERDSMFIVPIDGKPGWYRFHRLFRDLLLLRLRAHDPRREVEPLEAAARWHLAEGEDARAVEYLLRAHSWDAALALILGIGREYYDGNRMATVAGWLSQVPAQVRESNIDAEIVLAMAEAMSGRALEGIDALRMILARDQLTVGQRQIALAYLAAAVQFHPDPELFADTAREALAALHQHPESEIPDLMGLTSRSLLKVVSEVSLGRALLYSGSIDPARRMFESALKAVGIAYRPYRVHTLGSLALADALAGRLERAAELVDEALALAAETDLLTHPSPADAYLAAAIIAVQRGEPEAGADSLRKGALRAAANERIQLMWIAWLTSTVIESESGHPDLQEPPGPRPQFVRRATAAQAMRHARLRGAPILPPAPAREWSFVAFEEIAALITMGRLADARIRLTQLAGDTDTSGPLPVVEHELLWGWLEAVDGRQAASHEHLRSALTLAEPDGLVYPFMRAGALVADLIDQLPGAGNGFRRLVVARGRAASPPREGPTDGLTPRELELIAYLPTRLTIADIAERCFVSTNTIKTHLGHIYRKLEVQGRDAAVDRANELGLIDIVEAARAY